MTDDIGFSLRFKYYDGTTVIKGKRLDIGKVTSFTNTYEPSVSQQPVPVLPAEDKFIMDLGVERKFALSFVRVSPREPNDDINADSREWSNGFWMYVVQRFIVNRWQQETDGCKMLYNSNNETNYPSIGELNVYVTEFSPGQQQGIPNVLSGTLKLTVGSLDVTKVATRYTIVYKSNFSGNTEYSGAESNIVKVWDLEDAPTAMAMPQEWITQQLALGITVNNPVWADDTTWTASTKYYKPDQSQVEMDRSSILTLYARYNYTP